MNVTIKAVAKAAGVSVGTVSHVLNHPDRVARDKRLRVERAVKELGYIPSEAGQRLRKGSSQFVGVLVLDIANPFFAQASESIEEALAERGYYPMILSYRGDAERELAIMRMLASQQVHGLIVTPSDYTVANLEKLAVFRGKVVFMDSPPIEEEVPTVSSDDVSGARKAIAYLSRMGHRNLGFINGPNHIRQARDRREGVRQELRVGNISVTEVNARTFGVKSGHEALKDLLKKNPNISAVFCASDQLAIGAIRALREIGRKVPEDISIVGYDDIDIATDLTPALSTIRQPMEQIGRTSVDLLFEDHEQARHVVYSPTLIKRDSVSKVSE
ncbi:LacI family DNA-binding transcriptional regulator [Gleimia europaea]|uniref:LacI family DNA-binding transcriptional regulator n=1 Tax=Gleimia europaea TaxID=66228 RepID=UPI0027847CC0|nr:LacI family DNA-binding transcriptional regulator [Gleimia europaea]MDP9833538.1 LacI family transcriptional regulator [Gleimia europaea]